MWVAVPPDGQIVRVDVPSHRIVQRIGVGASPSELAAGDGVVWVADAREPTITRIDARTGDVLGTTMLHGHAGGIALGFGAVWATMPAIGRVARLDPRSGRVRDEIAVGSGAGPIVAGADGVWVANALDSTVSLIDPDRDAVTFTRQIRGTATAIAATGQASGSPPRTRPRSPGSRATSRRACWRCRRRRRRWPRTAAACWCLSARTGRAIAAARCAYAPGCGSPTPTPTCAATRRPRCAIQATTRCWAPRSLRARSARWCRTWRWRCRARRTAAARTRSACDPDLRYWTGRPVRASDFRRGIELALRFSPSLKGYLDALPGVRRCTSRHCDLRAAVRADDDAGTVTLHLARPDPELLWALSWSYFAPAPTDSGPIPGTGPYRIARYVPNELVDLRRNPHFRERAPAARPDGFPDRIVWEIGRDPAQSVDDVIAGRADFTEDHLTSTQLKTLRLQSPDRLHTGTIAGTEFAWLNTRARPFDDIQVRRALAFAVDRGALARQWPGARPLCQILPATVPGHVPYCPYTRRPNQAGEWSAPDLARARRSDRRVRHQGHGDHLLGPLLRRQARARRRLHGLAAASPRLQGQAACDRCRRRVRHGVPGRHGDLVFRRPAGNAMDGATALRLAGQPLLRSHGRPLDASRPAPPGNRSGRRQPPVGTDRPPDHRPGAMDRRHPARRAQRRLGSRRRLSVRPQRTGP